MAEVGVAVYILLAYVQAIFAARALGERTGATMLVVLFTIAGPLVTVFLLASGFVSLTSWLLNVGRSDGPR